MFRHTPFHRYAQMATAFVLSVYLVAFLAANAGLIA